jgi:hypothetical protein
MATAEGGRRFEPWLRLDPLGSPVAPSLPGEAVTGDRPEDEVLAALGDASDPVEGLRALVYPAAKLFISPALEPLERGPRVEPRQNCGADFLPHLTDSFWD